MILLYHCKLLTHQYHFHSTSNLVCNDKIANLHGTCNCKLTPKVPLYYLVSVPSIPSPNGVAAVLLHRSQNPTVPAFHIIAEGGVAALHIINMQQSLLKLASQEI